jgi:hypothetical protein
MNLSDHFTLGEFTRSQTASRLGINNQPRLLEIGSMMLLCEKVLEPVREHFNKFVIIESGYRSEKLNKTISGSSATSQHIKGEAADITVKDTYILDVFKFIKDNLDFDQLIYEHTWVHVSCKETGNRKDVLESVIVDGKTKYKKWVIDKYLT